SSPGYCLCRAKPQLGPACCPDGVRGCGVYLGQAGFAGERPEQQFGPLVRVEDPRMLIGSFRAGTGKGLARTAAVFGEQGTDPAANSPCAGSQIGVVRRG